MERLLIEDVERCSKRLKYYKKLQQKPCHQTCSAILKWIDIYSERLFMLQKKCHQLGLRVEMATEESSSEHFLMA